MFFMIGIVDRSKDIPYTGELIICPQCGAYGRYSVVMSYTALLLFFIPTLRWNKRFYVTTSCCGTIYELDPEIGKRVATGENITILPEHLHLVSYGRKPEKRCPSCGYQTTEDFEFCPKCGSRF